MSHPARSAARLPWSLEEDADLRDLLAEGYGPVNAARLFRRRHPDRSEGAVLRRVASLLGYGGAAPRVRVSVIRVRSQLAVATLMGVAPKTVAAWIAHGWLATSRTRKPRRAGTGRGGPTILIHDLTLHAMLATPAAWPAVDPARIADPDWRQEAEAIRAAADGHWLRAGDVVAAADGHWLRAGDVVAAAGYTPQQAARLLARYPGPLRRTTWQRKHYLWSADVPAFVAWLRARSAMGPREDAG